MADLGHARQHRASASSGCWRATGRRPRSCSAPTSRRPRTCSSRRRTNAGLRIASGLVVSDRNLRARPRGHARRRLRSEPRAARALARPRPPALRRDAALQRVLHRGDARRLPGAARRDARPRSSRATSTRARARSTFVQRAVPEGARLHRHLRARRAAARRARCSPTTSTSPTSELQRLATPHTAVAHCPSSQRLPGLRHLPDGPPRRARRALRDGHRRRRGHRPEHAQGGPRRLPRADGPRPGPHARARAPALSGDRGGRGGARARGHLRRPRPGQAGRPRAAQSPARTRRSKPCSKTRRTGTPRSARSSRSPARSAWSRPASAATSCSVR